ncbi:GNAT family N-acetyltransferase [Corynebacterium aquilae]|uniref:N-acetyltransferase domain-containing protein n=1 Tax=Corynebacterium aquilae DSM 44791 TaxID=1431546 RepID=A0A1L7CGZ4_9CORY|nr:N-acetyltransferase [Corynebacterium aquilae]APT85099.1 hypothetical protein CAQU_08485 [Corynebacterium aquilae DSM 44791]
MSFSVEHVAPHQFAALCPRLVDIYLSAMDYPKEMFDHRVPAWIRAIYQPGFSAVVAFHTEVDDPNSLPTPIGVAYGSLGTHLDWWHSNVRQGLIERGLSTDVLHNYFELTEVHVHPTQQGQGIGRQLIEKLAQTTSAEKILLSTPEVPDEHNRAFHLYRDLGFTDVLRHFHFPGDERPFAILGAPLPLAERQPHP